MTTDTVAESKKIWGVLTGLPRFVTLAKLSKLAQESAPRLLVVLVVCGVVLSNTVNVREIAAFYESVRFCNVASILKEALRAGNICGRLADAWYRASRNA